MALSSVAARRGTLTPGRQSEDDVLRSTVDANVFAAFVGARTKFNACNTEYAKNWELVLFPIGSDVGKQTGAVKFRHKACSALHGISNLAHTQKKHKCETVI